MGVDESIVTGIGAVIFNSKLELPGEDDFKNFTPQDYFVNDAYDEKAPIVFFYESHVMNEWAPGKNQFGRGVKTSSSWSIADLDGDIYKKETIIEKIIERIKSTDKKDDAKVKDFKEKVEKYLDTSKDVYFGRFIYWYFS